jgi:hypothetical protein
MVRIHPDPPVSYRGGVAQLGERLLCKQEVIGSIPFTSTTSRGRWRSDARRDFRLSHVRERSQVSFEAYFWSFGQRGCLLFNNLEETSVLISQDQHMGCDCIQNGSALVGWSRHKRENSCSCELRSQARPQGYRVKRISAYGGCLGDHRR